MAFNTQIVECFLDASALKQYRDKWLSDDRWVIIMCQTYNFDRVDKATLNRALCNVFLHPPLKLNRNKKRISTSNKSNTDVTFYYIASDDKVRLTSPSRLEFQRIYQRTRTPRNRNANVYAIQRENGNGKFSFILFYVQIHLLTSPKYHCELAGEGIEYSWGLSKKKYRNIPLEEKKGKENFNRLVRECIEFVRKENVIRFSAKCRRYMLAYLNAAEERLTYDKIDEFQRKCKTHRNIADQEKGFIARVWKESID